MTATTMSPPPPPPPPSPPTRSARALRCPSCPRRKYHTPKDLALHILTTHRTLHMRPPSPSSADDTASVTADTAHDADPAAVPPPAPAAVATAAAAAVAAQRGGGVGKKLPTRAEVLRSRVARCAHIELDFVDAV
jgi:hypothetical protein